MASPSKRDDTVELQREGSHVGRAGSNQGLQLRVIRITPRCFPALLADCSWGVVCHEFPAEEAAAAGGGAVRPRKKRRMHAYYSHNNDAARRHR